MVLPEESLKGQVRDYWERETAGTRYAAGAVDGDYYRKIESERYRLEPYIPEFAQFSRYAGRKVLEIGVGAGSDFARFAAAGALATGVDLTQAGIEHTRRHLAAVGLGDRQFELKVADAERMPFPDGTFDLVYSWGVLHHTPNTARAFKEAARVLKPAGELRAMIYHTRSWTVWMLWLQHGLLKGRPWRSPKRVVFERLESPGTKLYTRHEARRMLESLGYSNVRTSTALGPGDLLLIKPSDKYRNPLWKIAWAVYPRWFVRMLGDRFGLYLMIEATKPAVGPRA